jgi:hypothetical protein
MGVPHAIPARDRYDDTLAALRAHLGEQAFTEASDAGRTLSLEHALAEALADAIQP